jgi:hypothetical protein
LMSLNCAAWLVAVVVGEKEAIKELVWRQVVDWPGIVEC